MTVRKWQSEPQSIQEARSPSGSWFPARMFSFVLCVAPKDAGIGIWPLAGLLRWSSMASKWPSRRFQLPTPFQSNVPAKSSFRSTGRVPMRHRLCAQRYWKLHCDWTHDNARTHCPREPRQADHPQHSRRLASSAKYSQEFQSALANRLHLANDSLIKAPLAGMRSPRRIGSPNVSARDQGSSGIWGCLPAVVRADPEPTT
jgi:hypothetical protein